MGNNLETLFCSDNFSLDKTFCARGQSRFYFICEMSSYIKDMLLFDRRKGMSPLAQFSLSHSP